MRGTEIAEETARGQESLRDAFAKHYLGLLKLCIVLAGTREAAEDLAQESFVRIAPKLGQLAMSAVDPPFAVLGCMVNTIFFDSGDQLG